MNYNELLRLGKNKLKKKFIEQPSLDCEVLLSSILKCSREILLINLDKLATKKQIEKFNVYIKKRESRRPVSQIIGKKEFWKNNFIINNYVLTPRPETELIIEKILHKIPGNSAKIPFSPEIDDRLAILSLSLPTSSALLSPSLPIF